MSMYGCLFCLSGKEPGVKKKLENRLREAGSVGAIVWFPKKDVRVRRNGRVEIEKRPLFPGYLFFYIDGGEDELRQLNPGRTDGAIRLLSYADGTHALRGGDLKVARWIEDFHGEIGISTVVFNPGERVKIIDGPMTGMEGLVKKVDRHRKKVWVDFDFDGMLNNVVLDVDVVHGDTKGENK